MSKIIIHNQKYKFNKKDNIAACTMNPQYGCMFNFYNVKNFTMENIILTNVQLDMM